jgi:hypothetical protein
VDGHRLVDWFGVGKRCWSILFILNHGLYREANGRLVLCGVIFARDFFWGGHIFDDWLDVEQMFLNANYTFGLHFGMTLNALPEHLSHP